MDSSYHLFDLISGNVLDVFARESDAVDILIAMRVEHGDDAVRRFALTRETDDESTLVAMADDLLRRVHRKPAEASTAALRDRLMPLGQASWMAKGRLPRNLSREPVAHPCGRNHCQRKAAAHQVPWPVRTQNSRRS